METENEFVVCRTRKKNVPYANLKDGFVFLDRNFKIMKQDIKQAYQFCMNTSNA